MKYFEKLKEHYDADLDNIKLARFEDEEGRQCIEKTFYEDIEVRILSHFFFVVHHLVGDIFATEDGGLYNVVDKWVHNSYNQFTYHRTGWWFAFFSKKVRNFR